MNQQEFNKEVRLLLGELTLMDGYPHLWEKADFLLTELDKIEDE